MATTFYATNNFTGNGSTVNWNINFADGYIESDDVRARYLDDTGSYVDIAIASVAGNVVTITPAVATGQDFQIYRDTEKRFPLVDFSDGAILNETNLDTLATQAVMVSAEAFDQSNNGVRIAGDSLVVAQGIDAKAQLALDNSTDAVATADGIAATAAQALTNSNTAISTANAANSTANGIAATAAQALTNSNTAITTANGAVSTADSAAATANAIDGKAQTAIDTANSAVTTANSASTKADTAISTADSATATANAIDGKAQTALDNVAGLDGTTLKKAANLSDVGNAATARVNLSVYSKAGIDGMIASLDTAAMKKASNLSDVGNVATARTNLSVYSKAEVDARTGLTTMLGFNSPDRLLVHKDATKLQILARTFEVSCPPGSSTGFTWEWVSADAQLPFDGNPVISCDFFAAGSGALHGGIENLTNALASGFVLNNNASTVLVRVNIIAIGKTV